MIQVVKDNQGFAILIYYLTFERINMSAEEEFPQSLVPDQGENSGHLEKIIPSGRLKLSY